MGLILYTYSCCVAGDGLILMMARDAIVNTVRQHIQRRLGPMSANN